MRVLNSEGMPRKRQGQGWWTLLQEGADALDTKSGSPATTIAANCRALSSKLGRGNVLACHTAPHQRARPQGVESNEHGRRFFRGHQTGEKRNYRSFNLRLRKSYGAGIVCRD